MVPILCGGVFRRLNLFLFGNFLRQWSWANIWPLLQTGRTSSQSSLTIGMKSSQWMEVCCPGGMRLWHISPMQNAQPQFPHLIHPKPHPNGATAPHLWDAIPTAMAIGMKVSHHWDGRPNHANCLVVLFWQLHRPLETNAEQRKGGTNEPANQENNKPVKQQTNIGKVKKVEAVLE